MVQEGDEKLAALVKTLLSSGLAASETDAYEKARGMMKTEQKVSDSRDGKVKDLEKQWDAKREEASNDASAEVSESADTQESGGGAAPAEVDAKIDGLDLNASVASAANPDQPATPSPSDATQETDVPHPAAGEKDLEDDAPPPPEVTEKEIEAEQLEGEEISADDERTVDEVAHDPEKIVALKERAAELREEIGELKEEETSFEEKQEEKVEEVAEKVEELRENQEALEEEEGDHVKDDSVDEEGDDDDDPSEDNDNDNSEDKIGGGGSESGDKLADSD